MFEWDDARYFLAVQRTESLSAAGRQLNVNQSTVGRRIRALEDALGARLFVQTPDGYFLSPAGERLLPLAARMEDAALGLERDASGHEAGMCGTVRVTGPDALGARIIAPLLADFHNRTPGVDIELLAENRTLSLTKREADMAVRTTRPREPSIVMRRICDFSSALYASEKYVAENGRPRDGDYAGRAFVSVDDATWAESLWLARAAPTARVVFKTNSTFAQLAATLEGVGLGILPCYIGDVEPTLVRLLPPEDVVTRPLWLVLHRDLQHSVRIRACADFLVDALAARAPLFMGKTPRKKDRSRKSAR